MAEHDKSQQKTEEKTDKNDKSVFSLQIEVACIVYFIFRIQRMKKVRHQVMHRTQVTPNAIWKHCELRKDLYFYIFHALPGSAFEHFKNPILNL